MTAPVDAPPLRELIATLDLETKVRLVTGAGVWWTAEEPSIGLSSFVMADGPVGVRGPVFSDARVAANLPSSSALAASWDDDLLLRVGRTLAVEATRQGADVVLGPTINLHRSPLGGRHFECFSEDPYLSGRLATAYVRGLQEMGVGACPKHFVANDAETERTTVDNIVDERTLRELYLAPFEAVVADASPWSIMTAYNGVNGHAMSENPLLSEPLKGEWGWDGLVVSDWGGIYTTVESARAAIDLAMGGPDPRWCEPLLEGVRTGQVEEGALDAKIERLLRLAGRVGALKGWPGGQAKPAPAEAAAAGPLVREAAAAGTVLLRNDGVLPLEPASLQRLALIGPSALEPRAQGGGSAMVFPPYVVRPEEALRHQLGDSVEIVTAIGAQLRDVLRAPFPEELEGLAVRWLSADGEVLAEELPASTWLFRSVRAVHPGSASIEITARFLPPTTGTWRLGVSGPGSFELELDGKLALAETFVRDRLDMGASGGDAPQAAVLRELQQGKPVDVRLRYRWAEDFYVFGAGFGVEQVLGDGAAELARAVELARTADVAVVMVGTSEAVESEGFDRADLRLPGRQDDLVAGVAAVNPRTIVVVNAGSPVEMPWRDAVAALLVTWFPGMELGNALADVLLGSVEPGGRLPTTWPVDLATAPVVDVAPTDGRLEYEEGLHIGHRAYLRSGTEPAYWFGHGLGYTTWEYESLEGTSSSAVVRLRNTGDRAGKQVVQLYASRPGSALDRPAMVLVGYTVVRADAGESIDVTVPIDPRTLRHWDSERRCWQVEPGPLVLRSGPHAGDLPLQVTTTLTAT